MPSVFNSLRLLFGLAFGYIMLAELVTTSDHAGGLGHIIQQSQKRGLTGQIILVLMIIPVVALCIDRVLYWAQCELFPYRYGGVGMLNSLIEWGLHRWEDAKGLVVRPKELAKPLEAPKFVSGGAGTVTPAGTTSQPAAAEKQP